MNEDAWELFHRLWAKAVDTPDYDKAEWRELERAIPGPSVSAMRAKVERLESQLGRARDAREAQWIWRVLSEQGLPVCEVDDLVSPQARGHALGQFFRFPRVGRIGLGAGLGVGVDPGLQHDSHAPVLVTAIPKRDPDGRPVTWLVRPAHKKEQP